MKNILAERKKFRERGETLPFGAEKKEKIIFKNKIILKQFTPNMLMNCS